MDDRARARRPGAGGHIGERRRELRERGPGRTLSEGDAGAVEAAEESARRLVKEAKRQAGLIESGGRSKAERIRQEVDDRSVAIFGSIDEARARADGASDRLFALLMETAGSRELLRDRAGSLPNAPVVARAEGFAAPSARRQLALATLLPSVLYWTLVVLVSLALVAALILFLESRDVSSLQR